MTSQMLVVSDFGVVVTKYYEGYITDDEQLRSA
jgi:hypothetical protein